MRRFSTEKSKEGIDNRIGRKRLEEIRRYARDMYINGFRNREDYSSYSGKSHRSVDSYRAKIDSWFGEYQNFEKTDGGLYSICIDGRKETHNPLYNMWKSKRFTDKDLFLHFAIMSMSDEFENGISVSEFSELVDEKIIFADKNATGKDLDMIMDRATIQNKLNEYCELGILKKEKTDKTYKFYLNDSDSIDADLLNYASEVFPCGIIGSYLLDREDLLDNKDESLFSFKHHVISQAFDSEVMQLLFDAINQEKVVWIEVYDRKTKDYVGLSIMPLQIIRNVQTGRQYLGFYRVDDDCYDIARLDYLRIELKNYILKDAESFEKLRDDFNDIRKHIWAASSNNINGKKKERVYFKIAVNDNEGYIIERLKRESRNGSVKKENDREYSFEITVYDSREMIPWINSFIGRLVEVEFENKEVQESFQNKLADILSRY